MGQKTVRRGGDVGTVGQVPRLTRDERVARGRKARAEVPRSNHAEFVPAPDRPDPVELLQGDDASRVPELLPDILYLALTPYVGQEAALEHSLASTNG